MPSKNSLAELKTVARPGILPEALKPQQTRKTGPIGRPRKAVSEKRDYKITLSLTQGEGALIKAKAGLAPEAAYLYALLEKAGAFE